MFGGADGKHEGSKLTQVLEPVLIWFFCAVCLKAKPIVENREFRMQDPDLRMAKECVIVQ